MEELLVYRDMDNSRLVKDLMGLAAAWEKKDSCEKETYLCCVRTVTELAETYGLEGNLWHSALAFLLANSENAFSRASEKAGAPDTSISLLARADFVRLKRLFSLDWKALDASLGCGLGEILSNYESSVKNGHIINKRVRDRICGLGRELGRAKSESEFFDCVSRFYRDCGVGTLGLHKAFRIVQEGEKTCIQPITCTEHVSLDQLVGYERQKKKLIENTKNFVEGREANNVLLYGDAGTGKSSCIKAIMNEFYDQGIRLVEVYKHQFRQLPQVIAQIKRRNYKFIIYMDDLSFEEFETEYKYLKAVIEGGLENRPENVLIYATSNRRHLIRESFDDTKDYNRELHSSDTVQEKLSLAARFGVTVYFGAPEKDEYDEIVRVLARRAGIAMDEDTLLKQANQWELNHGGRSGRCAQQFVIWLKGQQAEG